MEGTPPSPLRLFVVETLGSGGMIHYAYQLCAALAREGASVTLVTTTDYELAALPQPFAVAPILRLWPMFDVHAGNAPPRGAGRLWYRLRWGLRRAGRGLRLWLAWVRLARFLLRQRPDVVQFGKISFPFEALFLACLRWRGLRLAQICHEFELRERGSGLISWLSDRLSAAVYRQFGLIFLHGRRNQARFQQLFPQAGWRSRVIEHGNEALFHTLAGPEGDLRRRYGLQAEQPVVLFFGNLTPSKGIPDLLQAFAQVQAAFPEARLLLAGYPNKFVDLPALQRQVAELGLAGSVLFDSRYIPSSEVAGLMRLARLVVYPYRSGTQSGSLQVAYAFARPVVATRVGGLPEVVEEGRSGFLVPAGQPAALAAAILKLVADPALAAEMGHYAHQLSQSRFAWEPIAAGILSAYRHWLASGAPVAPVDHAPAC